MSEQDSAESSRSDEVWKDRDDNRHRLWDDVSGQYTCPDCKSRVLRVADIGECTNCGKDFKRVKP